MEKLNPQKPGISQPRSDPKPQPQRPPERQGGDASETQPRKPDDAGPPDKKRQVPIEGE